MMRPKPSSSLQKTYDDCYMMCSTAVYFEGQNNEPEALRSWRSVLDAINQNKTRFPSNYTPKSNQDRALLESLGDIELQCRERVDILEALRESRKDLGAEHGGGSSQMNPSAAKQREDGSPASPGWIGDGTIPSLSYPELIRSPALPPRPAARSQSSLESVSQTSVERASVGQGTSSSRSPLTSFLSSSNGKPPPPPSTSPEKRTLLTTLRGKDSKYSSKPKKNSLSPRRLTRPAASRAADLAWNGISYPGSGEPVSPSARRRSTDSGKNYVDRPWPNLAADAAATAIHRPTDGGGRDMSHTQPSRAAAKPKQRPEYAAYRSEYQEPRPNVKQGAASSRSVKPGFASRTESGGPNEHSVRPRMIPRSQPGTTSSGPQLGHSTNDNTLPSPASDEEFGCSPMNKRSDLGNPALPTQDENKSTGLKNTPPSSDHPSSEEDESPSETAEYERNIKRIMKRLPKGVDIPSARQILNEIVVRGDEVRWDDVSGLETAKKALKEAVVYPFLRPDLFMGLREPARGMLLFGPPGTGKTMLARAVATESHSTFFSVSASSLTSKWHGESEKLVRALFALAKTMAPSIIFVDEIDSLLSARSTAGEGEASRRSKTEFLIQWSDLQRAAAGREQTDKDKKIGDPSRVLVLAATNMPWDIDEAARRRFVRRQYIPLPEDVVRKLQLQKLLSHQKHELTGEDIDNLVKVTDGFSGSDITSLAKDAAMGPLRNLGEALLHTPMDQIPPIKFSDFEASLFSIRPSVSREGLKEYEQWAKDFGERGG